MLYFPNHLHFLFLKVSCSLSGNYQHFLIITYIFYIIFRNYCISGE